MFETALVEIIDALIQSGKTETEAEAIVAALLTGIMSARELENRLVFIDKNQFRS